MDRPVRRCSFCGKKLGEVRLVAGPSDVYICQLCIALCQEILAHGEEGEIRPPEPPSPAGPGPLVRAEITSA